MTAPDLAHGENFSLEHYLDPAAHTFEQRFAEFRPYAQHARGSGFVLREVFGFGFPEVASAVGRSEAACRQLA
ncbi:hypothetical protein, partial [Nocardia abscessus]|uniref:hypothetical protein n=1 Tax=Nocardia abscessus TaxID=120957 RepID=UPI0024590F25